MEPKNKHLNVLEGNLKVTDGGGACCITAISHQRAKVHF